MQLKYPSSLLDMEKTDLKDMVLNHRYLIPFDGLETVA